MPAKTEPATTETVPVKHTTEHLVKGDLAQVFHPWKMFEDFREEMEELWRARNWPTFPHFPKLATKATTETWLPSTDVYRTNGDLVVKADLPGLKKEDVEVFVEDGFLVVMGERHEEKEEKEKEYFRCERNYGSFYRRVPLPEDFDAGKISAKVHDGILEVTVPLPAAAAKETKKIAVT